MAEELRKNGRARRARSDGATATKREAFLAVLSETSNALAAARAAGCGDARLFYRLRDRDPEFDAAWTRALDRGVEEMQASVVRAVREGKADMHIAIQLIGQHNARLAGGPGHQRSARVKRVSVADARAEILRRLDKLTARALR